MMQTYTHISVPKLRILSGKYNETVQPARGVIKARTVTCAILSNCKVLLPFGQCQITLISALFDLSNKYDFQKGAMSCWKQARKKNE